MGHPAAKSSGSFLLGRCQLLFLLATAFLVAEDAGENLVDILELTLQVEGVFDLRARDFAGDLFVGEDQVVEIQILFPGAHGVGLDKAVGVFTGDAVFDQV